MTDLIQAIVKFSNVGVMAGKLKSWGIAANELVDVGGEMVEPHPVHKYGHACCGPVVMDDGSFMLRLMITPAQADHIPDADRAALDLVWRSDQVDAQGNPVAEPTFSFIQYDDAGQPRQVPDQVDEEGNVLTFKNYVREMHLAGFA